jgi:hypothetical protein
MVRIFSPCGPSIPVAGAEARGKQSDQKILQEDTMSLSEYVAGNVWVQEKRQGWPPRAKLILAFILGFLLLSPAILGIYWEMLLAP